MEIDYPHPALPGPTPLRIDVPDDWVVAPAPGAAFMAASPEEVDGMHPSLTAVIRRVPSSLTLGPVIEEMLGEASGLEGFEVTDPEPVEIDGYEAVVMNTSLNASGPSTNLSGPDAISVEQIHLSCVVPVTEHVSDVITVSFTHPAGASEQQRAEHRALLFSLKVG
ncbi:MAG: hypothetical protein KDB31_12925 [Microthrixaceae bacterium]|nr:hypothetical protein [Microthrixaceae bacterium]